ncbi:SH3 domain-binding glutamic acid-rich protein homolog [Chrysoperla carnea]|uniref:SH3 domain-binding glutamic acid-rich protein homolog n=1 Tax=Chrysoperla carnea TaxID=189513 RepID=UPI001D08455F|nr:SH3 domain-binding glutamic acid-rich protein homolog [Chrysoperla carnea]
MVITVYISGISGNKEVKKRQQRVQMILESKNVEYEAIDIAEPDRQAERDRVKHCGPNLPALPPQIFNGDEYCGDYDQFDLANETDELEKFLKLPIPNNVTNTNIVNDTERISPVKENSEVPTENGEGDKKENSPPPKEEEPEPEPAKVEEDKPKEDETPAEENNVITESKVAEQDEATEETPADDEE